jgi:hypothetical protein
MEEKSLKKSVFVYSLGISILDKEICSVYVHR